MRKIAFCLCAAIFSTNMHSQSFQNGDLEGIDSTMSVVPIGWQAIPYTDPLCAATSTWGATPDLTSAFGPAYYVGVNGYPHSGATFVSGLYAINPFSQECNHEGIMQSVSGFTPGNTYTIYFWQAVVKQENGIDCSGSWSVYANSILAGTTQTTYSNATFNSTIFPWEYRSVSFVASDTTLLIKFLPLDDDTNHFISTSDNTGALRMGIDDIQIFEGAVGLQSMENMSLITIYPNPGSGAFYISLDREEPPAQFEVDIYNILGELVHSEYISYSPTILLDLSILKCGYYLVRFTHDNVEYFQSPVIIQ